MRRLAPLRWGHAAIAAAIGLGAIVFGWENGHEGTAVISGIAIALVIYFVIRTRRVAFFPRGQRPPRPDDE